MTDDWEEDLKLEQEKEKEEEEKKKKDEEEKRKKEEEEKEKKKKKEEEEKKKKEEEEKKKKEEEQKKKKDNSNSNNIVLKTQKDFIELAQSNSTKIKKANPLPIFTLSYLKNIVELLGPTLELNQINDILNLTNKVYNQKLQEDQKKKKVSNKVNINVGMMNVKNKIDYNIDDYDDDNEEEEEEEEQDNNVDNYIK